MQTFNVFEEVIYVRTNTSNFGSENKRDNHN